MWGDQLVAESQGQSLNSIFDELADWEQQLKALNTRGVECEVLEP